MSSSAVGYSVRAIPKVLPQSRSLISLLPEIYQAMLPLIEVSSLISSVITAEKMATRLSEHYCQENQCCSDKEIIITHLEQLYQDIEAQADTENELFQKLKKIKTGSVAYIQKHGLDNTAIEGIQEFNDTSAEYFQIKQAEQAEADAYHSLLRRAEDIITALAHVKPVSDMHQKLSDLQHAGHINIEPAALFFNQLQKYEKQVLLENSEVEDSLLFDSPKDPLDTVKERAAAFITMLAHYDITQSEEAENLFSDAWAAGSLDSAEAALDNIQIRYAETKKNHAKSQVYRSSLSSMLASAADISQENHAKISALISAELITGAEYDEMQNLIIEHIFAKQEEALDRKINESLKIALSNLGYTVKDTESEIEKKLKNNEIIYLETPESDYRIMLKKDSEGYISTRFVRVVAQGFEPNDYERQKDREHAENWCRNYDRFLEELKNLGVSLDIKIRKEPSEEPVMYLYEKAIASQSATIVRRKDKTADK